MAKVVNYFSEFKNFFSELYAFSRILIQLESSDHYAYRTTIVTSIFLTFFSNSDNADIVIVVTGNE